MPTVPPHGRATVPFLLHPIKAGEAFSARSTLYFEWRGRVVQFHITVSGTVAEP